MIFELSKAQLALAFAAGVASFFAVSEVLRAKSTIPTMNDPVVSMPAARSPDIRTAALSAPRREASFGEQHGGGRGACRADVQRLCGDLAPGGGRIVRCLAERQSEISDACRAAVTERRAEREHHREARSQARADGGQRPWHDHARQRADHAPSSSTTGSANQP